MFRSYKKQVEESGKERAGGESILDKVVREGHSEEGTPTESLVS